MFKVSTLFLKIALIFLIFPVIPLCIFMVPEIGETVAFLTDDSVFFKWLAMFGFWVSVVPYFIALWKSFQLLQLIDHKEAFSMQAVKQLHGIKWCALVILVLHICLLPVFYLFADYDDAPGVIFVGCVVPFASLTIAVFAAVLQRLLIEAMEYKTENDLMI